MHDILLNIESLKKHKMKTDEKHLYDLNELSDYKISEGYADIRGWDVMDIDNRVIGKVDNLLANKEAQRVVYIDVEVDQSIIDSTYDPYSSNGNKDLKEFINKDGENHIIIPIGLLDVNSDLKHVYTHTVNHRTFTNTKRYRKGDNVNRAYEIQVLDTYSKQIGDQEYEDKMRREDIMTSQVKNTLDESRIRELIREEIRHYHDNGNSYFSLIEDNEFELKSKSKINPYDDENFYNRQEFENSRFKK